MLNKYKYMLEHCDLEGVPANELLRNIVDELEWLCRHLELCAESASQEAAKRAESNDIAYYEMRGRSRAYRKALASLER